MNDNYSLSHLKMKFFLVSAVSTQIMTGVFL